MTKIFTFLIIKLFYQITTIYRINLESPSSPSEQIIKELVAKLSFANFAEKRAALSLRRALNYYYLYSPEESTPAGKAESRFLERDRDTVTMELCKSSDYSSLQIGNRGLERGGGVWTPVSSSKEISQILVEFHWINKW